GPHLSPASGTLFLVFGRAGCLAGAALMRLDKYIAHATDLTRSQIHQLVRQGAISVNAETVRKAAQQLQPDDVVRLHGEVSTLATQRHLMLINPDGCSCVNHATD